MEWMNMSEATPGDKFRVIAEGCTLNRMVPVKDCHNAYTTEVKALPVGTIITWTGMKMGWGSDNIPLPNFMYEDFKGEFEPCPFEGWGSIPVGLITKES